MRDSAPEECSSNPVPRYPHLEPRGCGRTSCWLSFATTFEMRSERRPSLGAAVAKGAKRKRSSVVRVEIAPPLSRLECTGRGRPKISAASDIDGRGGGGSSRVASRNGSNRFGRMSGCSAGCGCAAGGLLGIRMAMSRPLSFSVGGRGHVAVAAVVVVCSIACAYMSRRWRHRFWSWLVAWLSWRW
jgi:hypothetical protein